MKLVALTSGVMENWYGVVADVLNHEIIVSRFKLQLYYYIHL